MINNNKHNDLKSFLFALILTIFILSRFSVLFGEALLEEWLFLNPGINLYRQNIYTLDLGELSKNSNPFHKPPLTSIIYGFFSNFFSDKLIGARIFSFIVSVFSFFVLFKITKSIFGLAILAFSYFFLISAFIIQTDILVLLSFLFFCLSNNSLNKKIFYSFVIFGFLLLWLTKIESALICFFCYLIFYLWEKNFKELIIIILINLGCVVFSIIFLYFFSFFTKFSFTENLLNIFYPVNRIVNNQLSLFIFNFDIYIFSIIKILRNYLEFNLLSLLALPFSICFIVNFSKIFKLIKQHKFFFIFFFIPFSCYFFLGYPGIQYPRYYIFPLFSLLILICKVFNDYLDQNKKFFFIIFIIFFFLNLNSNIKIITNYGNLFVSEFGKKDISDRLNLNKNVKQIITYENFGIYLENKNVYYWDFVIGDDSNSQKIKKNIKNIDAIIIKKSDLDTYYIKNILGYFIKLSNIYIVQKENYIIYSRVSI
jgi:hypothetical protein